MTSPDCRSAVASPPPATLIGTRRGAAWNLLADQRPEAVVFAESAEDVAATVALRRRERPPGRRSGNRPWRRRPRPAGGGDPAQDRADAERRDRPGRTDGTGGGRRPGRRAERGRRRTGPQLDARLFPGRRRHRLHAWRRAQLARPPLRLRLQPRAHDRVDHGRRRGAHGRHRERPRSLLGAARRRRRLRDRHRAASEPDPDRRDLRGRPRLPRRAGSRRGPHLPRLARECLRRCHLRRPLRHPTADPRRPRADPRTPTADDRRRLHRQPGGGRSNGRAAARARRDDHGHLGAGCRPPASVASTWTPSSRYRGSARG